MEDLEERRLQLQHDKLEQFERMEKDNKKKLKRRMEELEDMYKNKLKEMIERNEVSLHC